MTLAPETKQLRLDPATVVAHGNPKLRGKILNFGLDFFRS
jgi:hypothetical protein